MPLHQRPVASAAIGGERGPNRQGPSPPRGLRAQQPVAATRVVRAREVRRPGMPNAAPSRAGSRTSANPLSYGTLSHLAIWLARLCSTPRSSTTNPKVNARASVVIRCGERGLTCGAGVQADGVGTDTQGGTPTGGTAVGYPYRVPRPRHEADQQVLRMQLCATSGRARNWRKKASVMTTDPAVSTPYVSTGQLPPAEHVRLLVHRS
jgi:hypothetical protein